MNHSGSNPRVQLFRDALTLQLKLLVDGLRDAILIPLSLLATAIGLLRGGEDCDREYRRVIKLGLRSERWINLFGQQQPLGRTHPAGSVDNLLNEVESLVLRQARKGGDDVEPADEGEDRPD